MNIVLNDELEQKFRKAVFERKGMKKGNISEALEEAIELWIRERERNQAEKWKSVVHPAEKWIRGLAHPQADKWQR